MKKYFKYLIPSLITLIILLCVFYFNDMYPVGKYSIVRVDADYQYIPVLYRIYDFLHGNSTIIYDDIGLGNNIFISMVIQGSVFSPVNLLLYFTSRSNIINFYNIIILVKLCLISMTAYIYLDKSFKTSNFYKILGSVLYTFSGFILFNYFNLMWLDSVILFPLIMMYLDKLIRKDKYIGYVITLAMSLIITYYISFFILVFIVFYSFIYLFLNVEKEKRKKIIFRLGISTLIALLLSSFSTVPSIYQTIISSRFTDTGYYTLVGNVMTKSLHLLFSPLFIILSILYISKYKYDKVHVYGFLMLLLLYVIGVFVEPINLLLHSGSYWDFPYRYGFITSFILLIGSFRYIEKFGINGNKKNQIFRIILFILLSELSIYFNYKYLDSIIGSQIVLSFDNTQVYVKMIQIILVLFVINIIAVSFNSKYIRYITLSVASIVGIFILCSWVMYYEEGYYLAKNANDINNNLEIKRDGRYKIDYINYTPDYGFILDVKALDNWLHVIPDGEVDTYGKLGYGYSDTCIRSYGGTIFSDWLLNTKYLFTYGIKDYSLYEFIDNYEGKNYYKFKYSSYGVMFNNELPEIKEYNSFDVQNIIYKNLFNKEDNIIKVDNYSLDGNEVNIKYNIKDRGILYLDTDYYDDIEYIKIEDNYIYDFGDYIIDLGMYNNDTLINIKLKEGNYIELLLGFIKVDDVLKLESNVSYINDNTYYVDNIDSYKYLFLPINNIKGIDVYVNGIKRETKKYFNNFIVLELDKGENYITLKYNMPFFKLGIILSIVGILLFIFSKYIKSNKIISNFCYYLYILFVIILFMYFYFYSMIKYIRTLD